MANNTRTLSALRAVAMDERESYATVYVSQRFCTWLESRPQPGCTYEMQRSLRFEGVKRPITTEAHPAFGKYPTGTYVWSRAVKGMPNFWTLRQVSEREGEFGFEVVAEVTERMREPLEGDRPTHWEIIHWISDPDRIAGISVHMLTFETIAFRINDSNVAFEFKLNFDGRP